MKITKLILSGYKRLMLNNIKKITYTPESTFQLILGTNGSGKSSILYELSPLPAHKTNYIKGGYKEIELEHKGASYTLISSFESGAKYTFIKNGEYIKEDVNGQVMTEMVKQEFGITKEIHELTIGEVHFSSLAPTKRREWLTKLSHIDFTYALGVFKALASGARDAQGALKHVKSRIVTEQNKLLAVGDLKELDEKYTKLSKLVNDIFTSMSNEEISPPEEISDEMMRNMQTISDLSKSLMSNYPDKSLIGVHQNSQEINEELSAKKGKYQELIGLKHTKSKTLIDFQDLIKDFVDNGVDDVETLNGKIAELENQLKTNKTKLGDWTVLIEDAEDVRSAYHRVKASLIELIQNNSVAHDGYVPKDVYVELKDAVPKLRHRIQLGNNKLETLQSDLEHLKSLKKSTCPKCNHTWVPGKSERDEKVLVDNITKVNQKLKELIELEEDSSIKLEKAETYYTFLRGYREIINQSISLKPFWDMLIGKEYHEKSPNLILAEFNRFGELVDILTETKALNKDIEHLKELLVGGAIEQSSKIKSNISQLEEELGVIMADISQVNDSIKDYTKYLDSLNVFLEQYDKLRALIEQMDSSYVLLFKSHREENLKELLRKSQTELAFVQTKRSEKETLEGIIKDLEEDISELTLKHTALKALSNELSPTDGLIAEQLKGFINSFISNVNSVIEKIWNYDLEVIPCGLESGDLDYKFPLRIHHEGSENQTPDIAKGSEAQVEVVNFAFRLVTMLYLGLEEYPIYLDEFSKSFDEQHRINAMEFIKSLVETGNHSQLFLISHYASQFGGFASAEIMVLDSTNITVSKRHNEHVIFE